MRVGLVLEQLLAPVPGGTGRYSRELAAAVGRKRSAADTVDGWVAWHSDIAAATVPGLAGPHRLPVPRRVLAEAWRRGVGPTPSADVVHAPTLLVPPVRRGQRLIVTVHDAVPWTHPETLTPRGVAWHRAMAARAAVTADVVVVPTRAVADALAGCVAFRRVEVVGEGVAEAVATVPSDAVERAGRLELPAEYALVVGTLEPRKGLDVAVAATRDPSWPGLALLVVGPSGWGDSGLGDDTPGRAGGTVRRLGRLSDADLAVAYSRASVALVPSRSEGFGLPVLEAMTHGVPVVVSDVPALVEVAGDAAEVVRTGAADDLAAGVVRALTRAADLGARGRSRAAAFSWDEAAARCWQLYRPGD